MTPSSSEPDDIPEFKILSIGMQGAGKTVFLASLYRSASVWSEQRGFSLFCSNPADSAYLLSLYSQIIASDEPWPSGTPDVKEYQFNCIHPPPFYFAVFQDKIR
jgi:GTPase SAR1 family protein